MMSTWVLVVSLDLSFSSPAEEEGTPEELVCSFATLLFNESSFSQLFFSLRGGSPLNA